MKKNKIKLGVNIDHAATLRQLRGATTPYPDLIEISKLALKSGASQITIHLREDRRHIQDSDLENLSRVKIPLNLEMACTEEMIQKAIQYQPKWCCLVPEKREELTTEGGLNIKKIKDLDGAISKLQKNGILVSLFVEPNRDQVQSAFRVGADAVEFHTGHWVLANSKEKSKLWKEMVLAAQLAHSLKLRVHAGHGLEFKSVALIKKLPYLQEVNIGHSLICYSLEMGLGKAIQKMVNILKV